MGTLILVRHSVTAASAAGRNLGQRSDPPLAPAGVALAERLAVTLRAELGELPHDDLRILSSPASRCRQTAERLADGMAVERAAIGTAAGLLELDYGAWDGLTADECRARDPELRAAWEADPFATRCPDGESGADVARRSFAVLEPIEAWRDRDRTQPRESAPAVCPPRQADAGVPRPPGPGPGRLQHHRLRRF
jgi:broad specificity phosphatase PhoE